MSQYNLFRLGILLIALLLFIGCGGDEEALEDKMTTPKAEPEIPNFYPNTIGSRWVYRNDNGFQWAREVTGERVIAGKVYQVFAYDPPAEDTAFDFLKTPSYRITRNYIQFFVGGEVDQNVRQNVSDILTAGFDDSGNIRVNVTARSANDLTFFRIPPSPGQKWEVLNMKVTGTVVFLDFGNAKVRFTINWIINGLVVRRERVETPAGVFENTFKVQYSTKIVSTVEGEEETSTEELETVWLAEGVGMVKVEDEDGVAELVVYDVK
jgi:hypothetical protein